MERFDDAREGRPVPYRCESIICRGLCGIRDISSYCRHRSSHQKLCALTVSEEMKSKKATCGQSGWVQSGTWNERRRLPSAERSGVVADAGTQSHHSSYTYNHTPFYPLSQSLVTNTTIPSSSLLVGALPLRNARTRAVTQTPRPRGPTARHLNQHLRARPRRSRRDLPTTPACAELTGNSKGRVKGSSSSFALAPPG